MTPSDLIFYPFFQIDTAMALTSLSNVYLSNDINKFFNLSGRVTVNATLLFLENSYTSSVVVKRDVQKKLIEVIQARNNNIGNGNLYAQSRLNPIPGEADVNECAHGLRTPREEIAFTARPKTQFQAQIFKYGRSIFLSATSAQFFRYL